ncbi:MAG: type I methionyl aminopeptidase [Candidatus Cloacimonetes bacterium]|nr:type I methionyl aminopeptidase [Candidatus Cloacimonadota bacterium]
MITIYNKDQIAEIKKACRLAAQCLAYLECFVTVGQNTEKLNTLAHDFILQHNAVPAPLNYNNYPKSICTSINSVVCHGIPSENVILKNGDIINVDITVILDGYFGDTSKTFIIGEASDEIKLFVERTEIAMYKGIEYLKPGRRLSGMGRTIEDYVTKFKYSVVRDYGGHGIGQNFHEPPHVCHFYTREHDVVLAEGMVFTVEPMINKSKNWKVITSTYDGWTVYTRDKSLSAQFEHTIAMAETGAEILTLCE